MNALGKKTHYKNYKDIPLKQFKQCQNIFLCCSNYVMFTLLSELLFLSMYSAFKSMQTPSLFSVLCKTCSHLNFFIFSLLIIHYSIVPSSVYTQYPMMTKRKQDFRHFCKCIKKWKLKYPIGSDPLL